MRRGLKHFVWAVLVITAFVLGVGFGVYYYTEILVQLRAVAERAGFMSAQPQTVPAPPSGHEQSSYLTMASFDGPLPLITSETLDEPTIQEYLKQGAVVLPLGTTFGQPGNVVVTAHSSGSAAFGPYRFAFAKLAEVQPGDEFTVQTPTAKYTYRAYGSDIVWPHEVDRLPQDERQTVTLVTCWPLWTNFKRLLVHGELVGAEYNAADVTGT